MQHPGILLIGLSVAGALFIALGNAFMAVKSFLELRGGKGEDGPSDRELLSKLIDELIEERREHD